VSKTLKTAITLLGLICVLAIFIAPTIDMPDTVLRVHHSVTTPGLRSGGAIAIASVSIFSMQERASGSWHIFRSTRSAGVSFREVSTVMLC
jgi:hypothetical protein